MYVQQNHKYYYYNYHLRYGALRTKPKIKGARHIIKVAELTVESAILYIFSLVNIL